MKTFVARWSLLGTLTVWAGLLLAADPHDARGGEFHFTVMDLPDNTAAWLPEQVVIHRDTDLNGGVSFILENPTARTHVFFVEGLEEQIVHENGSVDARPLRVTIAPEETIRVVLGTEQFQVVPLGQGAEFRFFCPLHRGDSDPGGTIRIVHLGGTIQIIK